MLLWDLKLSVCCFPSMGPGHSLVSAHRILLIPVLQSVFTTRGIFLMNVACPSVWRYCSSMPRIFFRMGEMNRHNVIEGENCNV